MAHFTPDIVKAAERKICLPLLPVPVFVAIGIVAGLLVSTHESISVVARDYVCTIMCAFLVCIYYNYRVLRIIYKACEELVAYRKQMDEIHALDSKVRQRRSSMDLHRERLSEKN